MTEMQLAFCRLYAADPEHNATKAAISAGCMPRSAATVASRWLKKVEVSTEIANLRTKTDNKLDISAEKVLRELARLAFLDPRKMFNADGSLKPITELDDDTAAAIAGVEYEKLFKHFAKSQAEEIGTTTKVKLINKTEPLKILAQHLKLIGDEGNKTVINIQLATIISERRMALVGNGESES